MIPEHTIACGGPPASNRSPKEFGLRPHSFLYYASQDSIQGEQPRTGAATAYNIDDGGSSTMYFNGKLVLIAWRRGRPGAKRTPPCVEAGTAA